MSSSSSSLASSSLPSIATTNADSPLPDVPPNSSPAERTKHRYEVQIIQLDEVAPPPHMTAPKEQDWSCRWTTSSDYSSSSSSSPSLGEDGEEGQAEEWCSSESDLASSPGSLVPQPSSLPSSSSNKTTRILLWQHTLILPVSHKRKLEDDTKGAHDLPTKRPRHDPHLLTCPACDAAFESTPTFVSHPQFSTSSEACCSAVKYSLE